MINKIAYILKIDPYDIRKHLQVRLVENDFIQQDNLKVLKTKYKATE